MATTKVGAGLVNLDQAGSTSGLKMPSGTAFAGSAEQGMIRNDTTQTSQGAGSTMQHFNGIDWKNFDNKEIITPVTDNLLYEVKAGSLTDGSNTGPVTWSDESGNGNDWLIGQALNTGTSAVNTFTVNKADKYFECSPGSLSSGTGTGIETVSAIDLTVDCTVEMWLYFTGYTSSGYTGGFITYNFNGAKTGMYHTIIMPTTYYADLALYAGASSVYNKASNYATNLNTWYQHVFTINDTANEVIFYKNGVEIVKYTTPTFSYTSANDIAALGYPDYGSSQDVQGRVGILRGYTDVLTPDEVLQNYNANKADYGLS